MNLLIVKLPSSFYREHANDNEIMKKEARPYVQGTILSDNNNIYFIPFRTNLPASSDIHPEAYVPLKTKEKPFGGLDITKMVLLSKPEDVLILPIKYVTREEYNLLQNKQKELWDKVQKYVQEYQERIEKGQLLPAKYQYTTLRYFHKELNLPNKMPGIKKNTPTRNYHDPNFVPPLKNNKSVDRRI